MAGALSRLARRLAQRFDIPAYHGTRAPTIEGDLLRPGEGTPDRMLGPHFAADPRLADAFTVGEYARDPSAFGYPEGLTAESRYGKFALQPGGNTVPVWLRGPFKHFEGDSQWGPLRDEVTNEINRLPDEFIEWYTRSRGTDPSAPEELLRRYERGDPLLIDNRYQPMTEERVRQLEFLGVDPSRSAARLKYEDPEMPKGLLPVYGYESPADIIRDHDAYMFSNLRGMSRAVDAYRRRLADEGFSGVSYVNESPNEARDANPLSFIVTDPSAVRSWFARFGDEDVARPGLGYASGGLAKAASFISPTLGRVYDESVEFGKEFPGHNTDGAGDAARHAYAASRLAREYGPGRARAMGALYELLSLGADRRSTRMDEYNNEAGIGMAELEDAAARERIREMINRNQLETMPAGTGGGY